MSDSVPRSSNIINDAEMCQRFYREALRVTNSLRYRFFTVFEQMTSEDVVMECFVKILKGDISFDDSKNCKFETFVRMIVTCQLTDELKSLGASKRSGVCIPLDSEVPGIDGDGETNTLYNTISDERSKFLFDYSEIRRDLRDVEELISVNEDIIESIIELREDGYSASEISRISNIEAGEVRKRLQDIKSLYLNRCEGTSMTISDILYGDEETLESKKSLLLSVTSRIVDDITGTKLSDIIKLVLKNHSYKSIGECLNISEFDVRRFLTKYEEVLI